MAATPNPIQLAQLSRLLGADDLRSLVGRGREGGGEGVDLARLRSFFDARVEPLARALLEEAVASDDVVDAASAETYLEDRLAFFGELLSEEQGRRVRASYMETVRRWG
jgi:hypothetical protein